MKSPISCRENAIKSSIWCTQNETFCCETFCCETFCCETFSHAKNPKDFEHFDYVRLLYFLEFRCRCPTDRATLGWSNPLANVSTIFTQEITFLFDIVLFFQIG